MHMPAAHNIKLAPVAAEAGATLCSSHAHGFMFYSCTSAACFVDDVHVQVLFQQSRMDQSAEHCDKTASRDHLGFMLSDKLLYEHTAEFRLSFVSACTSDVVSPLA